ncbi:MAG: hypothetical protein JOZ80_19230, partial [Acidobacteriaceae bacterium]|nr:hypothetical protein [Acidobacteriaceae bacterium]
VATVVFSFLCVLLAGNLCIAFNDNRVTPQRNYSADDFDWRDMVPQLAAAAALPGEQAIKAVLENSTVLRIYEVDEIRTECHFQLSACAKIVDRSELNQEVTRRIDEIVQEGMFHKHKSAVVDYQMTHGPFPFSEIAAVRSDSKPEAYVMLQLADHSYTAAQLQAKYGPPVDTNIFQWYSVFKYRVDNRDYRSDAVFEVDPTDGAVLKIAISLKMKKSKQPQ